jgi:superfamily II DNA or RNA helicase
MGNVGTTIRIPIADLEERDLRKLHRRLTFAVEDDGQLKIVTVYREHPTRHFIEFPRGAWQWVPNYITLEDKRTCPIKRGLRFAVELDATLPDGRSFSGQRDALEAMREAEQGMVVMQPGRGKTQIALAFAAQCNTRTLVLVHTEDILQQWVDYTQKAIPSLADKVGVIRGKTHEVGHITIAMVHSLRSAAYDEKFYKQFGCVIVDEAHHSAAQTWEVILNLCPAKYRFGFTATKRRADNMEPLNEILLGPVIYEQPFRSPIPVTVERVNTRFYYPYSSRRSWSPMVRALVNDKARNQLIAKKVDKAIQDGHSVLVLSREIQHLVNIEEAMRESAEILTAKRGKKLRVEILGKLRSGEIKCVLATQLADEALDVPRLSCVALVYPGKHDGRLTQQIGRALREHPSKDAAVIFDFVDGRCPVLFRQWKQRRMFYKEAKLTIIGGQNAVEAAARRGLRNFFGRRTNGRP